MSVSKHLIVPGMAKSGTTFLWDQLVNRTDKVNYYPAKEIGYLAIRDDWEGYMNFFPDADPEKVYLDSTPQYGDTYKEFAGNAKALLKDQEVQVVFCLRDPIARAFSHYRHDLSTHFWASVMGDYSFLTEGSFRRYVRPYHDIIKVLKNAFGAENVHGYSFKQSKNNLPAPVLKMLGLRKNWKLDLTINPAPGGGLPRLAYDPKRPTFIAQDGNIYKLPPKTLLVATNIFSQLYHNYPEELANKVLGHAANWTKELDRSVFGSSWKQIQRDYDLSLRALGMETEKIKADGMIPYKGEMPISQQVLDQLELVDSASDLTSRIYASSKASDPFVTGNEDIPDEDITLPGQAEKIQRVFKAQRNLPERKLELRRTIEQFGPIGPFLTSYINMQIALGDGAEAVRILDVQPHAERFVNKGPITNTLKRMKEKLSADDVEFIVKRLSLDMSS